MKIIPAVDILDGKCAQLVGGNPKTAEFYGDPLKIALEWEARGAEVLHVIDLDAALTAGAKNNLDTILSIVDEISVPVEVGGGIRDEQYAHKLLSTDIDRIILGTLAFPYFYGDNLDEIRTLTQTFGKSRMIFAADYKSGKIVLNGWQDKSDVDVSLFIKKMQKWAWGFLATNVEVEGRMKGIDHSVTKRVVESTKKPIIASGGITTPEDVSVIADAGAWGVVIGKALYAGLLDFEEISKL